MNERIARQINAYRLRAEEVRTVAEATHDEQCRRALLGIAADYDRLASSLQRMYRDADSRAGKTGNSS